MSSSEEHSFSTDSSEDENDLQESDESEEEQDETVTLRNELADIPLGELKDLKDKIGLKRYNEALFGKSRNKIETIDKFDDSVEAKKNKTNQGDNKRPTKKKQIEKKSKLKSEPEEISSKKRLTGKRPRVVVPRNNKRSVRDPRFSELSGKLNEDLFEKSYAFVRDMKDKEYEMVKKKLRKVRNEDQREKLLRLKQKYDSDLTREREKQIKRETMKKRREEEIEKVKQGKKAFYLKNSHQKKIELADKFRELKSTGRLDSYMKNKRKRKTMKEKKHLPNMKIT